MGGTDLVHQGHEEQVRISHSVCFLVDLTSIYHRYINRHNIATAEAFFPNMVLEELDAGHWGE